MEISTIGKLVNEERWEIATFVDKDSNDSVIGILECGHNLSALMLKPIGYKPENFMKNTHPTIAIMATATIEKVTFACMPYEDQSKQGICFYGRLLKPIEKD